MGHLHINTADEALQRKFWTDVLGGQPIRIGPFEAFRFPDAIVMVRRQEPAGGTEGSVVNHLGFQVPDLQAMLAKCRAAGIPVVREMPETRQAFVMVEQVKVELTETPGLKTPVAHHHIHFYNQAVDETKAWYVRIFGAIPGKRGRFEAADVPGANLTFSQSTEPVAPTKGRAVDHIGFEVRNLKSFCEKLERDGVAFEAPYREVPQLGVSIAFIRDPWGTLIELTEGLSKY
ncbi:MAG: VOC family protein [Bryobacteraceae bacterium]